MAIAVIGPTPRDRHQPPRVRILEDRATQCLLQPGDLPDQQTTRLTNLLEEPGSSSASASRISMAGSWAATTSNSARWPRSALIVRVR